VEEMTVSSRNVKFLVYVPRFSRREGRFRTVGHAVVRIAETLGASIEIAQRRDILSVWVYYKNNAKEEIPVYSDWGKNWGEDDVYQVIMNRISGVSFLPGHAVLQVVRGR
jgi:hypothetical protein